MTMMSRPVLWWLVSAPWIFPKNVALALTSSMYLTLMPVFFWNWSIVGRRFVFSLTSM
jgi:hypothetical protein